MYFFVVFSSSISHLTVSKPNQGNVKKRLGSRKTKTTSIIIITTTLTLFGSKKTNRCCVCGLQSRPPSFGCSQLTQLFGPTCLLVSIPIPTHKPQHATRNASYSQQRTKKEGQKKKRKCRTFPKLRVPAGSPHSSQTPGAEARADQFIRTAPILGCQPHRVCAGLLLYASCDRATMTYIFK